MLYYRMVRLQGSDAEMARYKHDVFISYSHLDDRSATDEPGWVSQFRKALVAELSRRLGRDVEQTIWRDDRLNGQHAFDKTIETALQNTGIMIALYSASYATSDYCKKEREWFVKAATKDCGIDVGDQTRLFNVRLMNFDRSKWPAEFANHAGFEFFSVTANNKLGRALDPSAPLFKERLADVVVAAGDVLDALEQLQPTIVSGAASIPKDSKSGSGTDVLVSAGAAEISAESVEFELLKESFRQDFRKNFNKIRILSARKDLHDQLHELQFKFYEPVHRNLSTSSVLDASDLEIVREHGFLFAEILDALREVVGRNLLPANDISWVDELADEYHKLEKAFSEVDELAIRGVIRAIGRVLNKWPTRINAKLNETARELALADLAADLSVLCTRSSTFNLQLGDRVEKLRELDRQISELATIHDHWQSFDDDLGLLEGQLTQNFSELEQDWPFLKQRRATLYANSPATWAKSLVYFSGKMEDALKQKNVEEAQRFFIRYRSAARDRFYAADQDLKKGCQELERVGEPIEAVLKGV
jgi:hypothetical protein